MNKFFHFRQVNVNGEFVHEDKVRINILVEARTSAEANLIARDQLKLDFAVAKPCVHDDYNHDCGPRWTVLPLTMLGTETVRIFGLPVLMAPVGYEAWADTIIFYTKEGQVTSHLYAFGADIYTGGIPVPPEVTELIRDASASQIKGTIVGGGWRLGYTEGGPWSLVEPPDWRLDIEELVKPLPEPEVVATMTEATSLGVVRQSEMAFFFPH